MSMNLAALDYESLIKLTSDSILKAKFAEVPIALFWKRLIEEIRIYEKKRNASAITVYQIFLDIRKRKPSTAKDWTLYQIEKFNCQKFSQTFGFSALKKAKAFTPLRHCFCFVKLLMSTFVVFEFVFHPDF